MSAKGWPISARSASLQTIEIALADYKPHPQNPNTHPGPQLEALGQSLEQFEQVKNIVVWRGHYLAGHGLAAAATQRGLTTLAAVDVSEWNEDRAVAFMLADNRLPEMAVMDETALADLLASIDAPLEIPGFDEDFLKSLDFGDDDPPKDVPPQTDRAAELAVEWGTETGQVWELGDHRLAIGDCTQRAVVEAVMGGDKISILIVDAPYGMNLDTSYSNSVDNPKKNIQKSRGYKKVIGDDKPFDPTPLIKLFNEIPEQFYWGADYFRSKLLSGGSWIVWDKRVSVEDVKYSSSEFELCWSKTSHHRFILRVPWFGIIGTEQQDVQTRLHPAQKPLGVITPLIEKYGANFCLDPFLGSGTTLIACEQLGRQCRGIEIDPGYAAVTLQRYLDATGERGELVTEVTV